MQPYFILQYFFFVCFSCQFHKLEKRQAHCSISKARWGSIPLGGEISPHMKEVRASNTFLKPGPPLQRHSWILHIKSGVEWVGGGQINTVSFRGKYSGAQCKRLELFLIPPPPTHQNTDFFFYDLLRGSSSRLEHQRYGVKKGEKQLILMSPERNEEYGCQLARQEPY